MIIVSCITSAIITAASIVAAQSQTVVLNARAIDTLKILGGESVASLRIEVSLSNVSQLPQRYLPFKSALDTREFSASLTKPDGGYIRAVGDVLGEWPRAATRTEILKPGQTVTHVFKIGQFGYSLLQHVGKYELQISIADPEAPKTRLKCKPLTIEVVDVQKKAILISSPLSSAKVDTAQSVIEQIQIDGQIYLYFRKILHDGHNNLCIYAYRIANLGAERMEMLVVGETTAKSPVHIALRTSPTSMKLLTIHSSSGWIASTETRDSTSPLPLRTDNSIPPPRPVKR